MQANIITQNPEKMLTAKNVFDRYEIVTNFINKDYVEIQADTSLEIARYTAETAARELNMAIIREDHSFFINALGFPGPYINYLERSCPAEKLLSLMKDIKDRSAYFEVATAYAKPDGECLEYVFQVPVVITFERKGNLNANWDTILRFPDAEKTFAEYPLDERFDVWGKNYKKIAQEIMKKIS